MHRCFICVYSTACPACPDPALRTQPSSGTPPTPLPSWGGHKARTTRKARFAPHWEGPALQQGLKSGQLFRATLRVNPSDRSQGFVTIPGLPSDILIKARPRCSSLSYHCAPKPCLEHKARGIECIVMRSLHTIALLYSPSLKQVT